jgi:glyoxylase-like metal-dependent hydrolase (beta-lactamase superfamily II)
MRIFILAAGLLLSFAANSAELVLNPVKVAPDIYAVIGDLGNQTYENEGLNSNLGFVVTNDGVLVINTGPSMHVARALHRAIGKTTAQPVKWVVNLNSQNHYWLGNSHFKSLGAAIVAHKEADRIMRDVGETQLASSQRLLMEKAEDTTLAHPSELLNDKREIKLGKTVIQLLHFGHAHTPGDIVVWLPQQRIVFAGDIVYTERMLVVLPVSNSASWLRAFDKLAQLNPRIIIPGHGHPADMTTAHKDTRDYLAFLRAEIKKSLDKGEMQRNAEDWIDQSRFRYLANFELLARRNAGQIYLEMEKEAC